MQATDDLASLSKLDQERLVKELKLRYNEDIIYVRAPAFPAAATPASPSSGAGRADLRGRHPGGHQPVQAAQHFRRQGTGPRAPSFGGVGAWRRGTPHAAAPQVQAQYHGEHTRTLSPHIFAVAARAYDNLMRNRRSQCAVIRCHWPHARPARPRVSKKPGH